MCRIEYATDARGSCGATGSGAAGCSVVERGRGKGASVAAGRGEGGRARAYSRHLVRSTRDGEKNAVAIHPSEHSRPSLPRTTFVLIADTPTFRSQCLDFGPVARDASQSLRASARFPGGKGHSRFCSHDDSAAFRPCTLQ
ncbi:unnamed protein product, partial [Iphiclides podalirius]